MRTSSEGYQQCYNVQIAVDNAERIIVAMGITQSAADVNELESVLDTVANNVGKDPAELLADAGYRSEGK